MVYRRCALDIAEDPRDFENKFMLKNLKSEERKWLTICAGYHCFVGAISLSYNDCTTKARICLERPSFQSSKASRKSCTNWTLRSPARSLWLKCNWHSFRAPYSAATPIHNESRKNQTVVVRFWVKVACWMVQYPCIFSERMHAFIPLMRYSLFTVRCLFYLFAKLY